MKKSLLLVLISLAGFVPTFARVIEREATVAEKELHEEDSLMWKNTLDRWGLKRRYSYISPSTGNYVQSQEGLMERFAASWLIELGLYGGLGTILYNYASGNFRPLGAHGVVISTVIIFDLGERLHANRRRNFKQKYEEEKELAKKQAQAI